MSEPIHVNFSDDESTSEARLPESLPTGEYRVAITDVELGAVKKQGENQGKPQYILELTVQETGNPANDKYKGRKLKSWVNLFTGSGFQLSQLMRSTGFATPSGQAVTVPPANDLIGKQITALVVRSLNKEQSTSANPVYRSNVNGFKPINGSLGSGSVSSAAASTSELP